MTDEKRIVHRGTWWPERVVPIVVLGFALLMGWGPSVAIGAALAAALITALLEPRGPGRWTE